MTGLATLLLAAAFAAAAIGKLRSPDGFAATLGALVPGRVARPLSRAVPVAELALAALLLSGAAPRAAGLLALVLLAGFSAVLVVLARRPVPVACHCFGAAADAAPPVALARNAVLAAAALLLVAAPPAAAPLTQDAGLIAVQLTVGLGLACLYALAGALRPAPTAPRLRAGGAGGPA